MSTNASREEGGCTGWFNYNQKMKPQQNALAGGIIAMLSSGLFIGWGFVNRFVFFNHWTMAYSTLALHVLVMSWFAFAIAGFIICALIYEKVATKIIYALSNVLILISGVLLASMHDNFVANYISRVLAGFGHGIAYVAILTHASEILTPRIRGMAVSSIHFCIITGLFVMGSLNINSRNGINFAISMGIAVAVMSALGLIFTFIFYKESPVWYLKRKREAEALSVMIKLHNESQETWNIRNEFVELKTMVEEDELTSSGLFSNGNSKPLMLLVLMKVAYVCSFNAFTNLIRYYGTTIGAQNYGFMMLFGIRLFIGLVPILAVDTFGRRNFYFVSSGGMSLSLLFLGFNFWFIKQMYFESFLVVLYEIFGGIGMASIIDVYSTEAFGTKKKVGSIAFISTIEFLLQIFIYTIAETTFGNLNSFIICSLTTFALVMGGISIYLYFKLPETSKMSIRQTRNEFLKNGDVVLAGNRNFGNGISFM